MAKYDNPNDAQCSFNIEVKQIDGLIRNGKKGVGYAEQVWLKKNGRTYIINQGRRVHVRTLLLFQEMNSKLAFSELCICKMFKVGHHTMIFLLKLMKYAQQISI